MFKLVNWNKILSNIFSNLPLLSHLHHNHRLVSFIAGWESMIYTTLNASLCLKGDLCDREDAVSSDDSVSSPYLRQRPGATNRMSTKQRMSLSMGADLDQILQGEAREGRGTEEAWRSRLHRISSSLSLRHNLSCSSLSSCSTPPRSHSLASLDEPKGEKMNLSTEASPSSNHRDNHGRHVRLIKTNNCD